MNNGQVALVTGASSGLGRYTALALNRAGYRVFAGARSFVSRDTYLPGVTCLCLDVTDGKSVQAFVDEAMARSGRVDVLINCAGILVLDACEETGLTAYRQVMETNFFAMTEMVRAVMPHFRQAGAGKIVNFSSINGRMGIPFQSAYTASKHAIEGYSECLQMEVKAFGVRVMLVEPGDHRGGSAAYRYKAAMEDQSSPYSAARACGIRVIERDEAGGLAPDRLGEKVVRALGRKRLPFRLRVAKPDQRLALVLHAIWPSTVIFAILAHYYLGKKEMRQCQNG